MSQNIFYSLLVLIKDTTIVGKCLLIEVTNEVKNLQKNTEVNFELLLRKVFTNSEVLRCLT